MVYLVTTGTTATVTFEGGCAFDGESIVDGVTLLHEDDQGDNRIVRVDSAVALASFTGVDLDSVAHVQVIAGCDSLVRDQIPPELGATFVTDCGASAETPPADVVQQVGLPSSGSCTSIDDSSMAFGTSLTGGWSRSYAAWPNAGAGGPVCTRTLHFSTAATTWVLA